MGTRVHVAASACFVVSGLFMCGLGGALAFAEPPPPPPDPGVAHSSELLGGSVHRGPRLSRGDGDEGEDDKGENDGGEQGDESTKPRDTTKPGQSTKSEDTTKPENTTKPDDTTKPGDTTKPADTTKPGDTTEPGETTEPAETTDETTEPESPTTDPSAVTEIQGACDQEGSNRNACPSRTTTPTTTTNPPGFPGPGGGGGGGGGSGSGGGGLPSRWIQPPQMQLPPEAPTVVSAAPGLAVAAGELPLAPITLPVIVAPVLAPVPVLAPGLGGGGGGPGSPANPALPAAPRAGASDPPAGRDPLPANVGSNAVVPASSYRVGYAEYLRTAGMSQVAALAVPGVAGMLVLTGAGGLLGYRQAKAGHALRAGGTARFVN